MAEDLNAVFDAVRVEGFILVRLAEPGGLGQFEAQLAKHYREGSTGNRILAHTVLGEGASIGEAIKHAMRSRTLLKYSHSQRGFVALDKDDTPEPVRRRRRDEDDAQPALQPDRRRRRDDE